MAILSFLSGGASGGSDYSDEKAFFYFVTRPLTAEQQDKLWDVMEKDYLREDEDFDMALADVMRPMIAENRPLMLNLDWKAAEEVAWEANALAKTVGLDGDFSWSFEDAPSDDYVWEGLRSYQQWLRPQGYVFAAWDTGGDSYEGFVVKEGDLRELVELGDRIGFKIKKFDDAQAD